MIELEWLDDLWWMDPPFEIVRGILLAAEAATPDSRGYRGVEPIFGKQLRARRVALEFERRLKLAGIYVEGVGD